MTELISHHDHYFTTLFSVKREVGFDATIALRLVLFFSNIEIAFWERCWLLSHRLWHMQACSYVLCALKRINDQRNMGIKSRHITKKR